ncbi:MAG: tetratricopeptide repeat protein [Gemmatimonadales bacterium]
MPGLLSFAAAPPAVAQGSLRLPVSMSQLQEAVRRDSLDPAAHYNVALGYWNEKRYDDTERELKAAIALDPRLAPAYVALAYLPYARRPRLWDEIYEHRVPKEWREPLEQAARYERQAYLIDPLVDLRILGAVRGYVDWDFTQDWLAEFINNLNFGFISFQDAKYDHAYQRFSRLIEMFHADRRSSFNGSFLFWYRGLAAAQLQRWDDAIKDLQQLVDYSGDMEKGDSLVVIPLQANEYRYVLAYVHQLAGHLDQAVQLYQECLSRDIGLYMAHVQLANIYESARQYDNAIVERRRAVETNPDDGSLLLDLGITLGKAGQFKEGEESLLHAQSANPRDYRTPFWLGLMEMQLGRKQEAKNYFDRFLAVAPSRVAPMVNIAKKQLQGL